MVFTMSLNGDSLWNSEVLGYAMDNCNNFTSVRAYTPYANLLITATTGMPGECSAVRLAVNDAGWVQGNYPLGSLNTLWVFDAFASDGGVWTFGVQEADVARSLVIGNDANDWPVFMPLAEGWEFFKEDAAVAPNPYANEYGVLVAGHVGGQAASSRAHLLRISRNLELQWTATLSAFDRFTHIVAHPLGGYLALAIEGDPASYHLVRFIETTAGTGDFIPHPSSLILSASPNPFNPVTEVTFSLPREGRAIVKVFDILGQQVSVLQDGVLTAGEHRVLFDGGQLPTGIYFLRLEAASRQTTLKLVLLK